MPAISFDKRKVSPIDIDFVGVTTRIDTELAKTLLRYREWKFISATDRHHVSQSTVSTRIHAFEYQLGCRLRPQEGWHNANVYRSTISKVRSPHAFERWNRWTMTLEFLTASAVRWSSLNELTCERIPAEVTSGDARSQAGDIRSCRER